MGTGIHFPELRPYRVEHRLPLLALLGLAAVVLFSWVLWAAAICLVGAVALGAPMLVRDLRNAWNRRCWSRSFSRRVNVRGLEELTRAHPGRYRLHARLYQGFGMNMIKPATLVEDVESGQCFPIVPSVKDPASLALRLGLEIEVR